MLPSAPKLYEYANESRFRNIVGQALSANALALSSLRTAVNTVTPSGAIDFEIAADGTVTMKITAIANALSVGYIVDAAGYDTDSSGQTLANFSSGIVEVDLGVHAPGDVFYVTAWFYSAAAGAGDASTIATARKFDYDAEVGPLSVTDADLADNAVITRTIDDGAVTFAKLDAMVFPTTYGGTGLSSFAQGDMLYYNAGTLLSKLAHPGIANRVLTSTSTGPQWVASLTGVDTTGNAATATALQTSRNLWGVAFNGTSDVTAAPNFALGATLGGTISGTPTWASTQSLNTSGNAGTATTLQTTRTIWGQNFNGSANVSGALSGATTVTASSTFTSTVASGSNAFVMATGARFYGDGGTNNYFDLGIANTNTWRWVSGGSTAATVSSTQAVFAAHVYAGAGSNIGWTGRTLVFSPSDGVVCFTANVGSGFSYLQLGGTTSSFPALRRNGAALDVIAADASVWALLQAGSLNLHTGSLQLIGSGVNHSVLQDRAWLWTSDGTASGTIRGGVYTTSGSVVTIGVGSGLSTVATFASGTTTFTGTVTAGSSVTNLGQAATAVVFDSGATSYIAIRFNQNGVARGFLGADYGNTITNTSTNGDMVLRSDGSNIRFSFTAVTMATMNNSGHLGLAGTAASATVPLVMTKSVANDTILDFRNSNATNGYGAYFSTAANDSTRYVLRLDGNTNQPALTVWSNKTVTMYGALEIQTPSNGFQAINITGVGTGGAYFHFGTTGSDSYWGVNNSAGTLLITGAAAYASLYRNDVGHYFGSGTTLTAFINSSGGLIATSFGAFGSDSATRIVHTTSSSYPTSSTNPYVWAADGTGAFSAGTLVLQSRSSSANLPIIFATGTTTPVERLRIADALISTPVAFRSADAVDAGTGAAGAFRFYDGSTFRGGFGTDLWAHGGSASDVTVYSSAGNIHFTTSGAKRLTMSGWAVYPVTTAVMELGGTSNRFNAIYTVTLNASGNLRLASTYAVEWGSSSDYLVCTAGTNFNFILSGSARMTVTTSALTASGLAAMFGSVATGAVYAWGLQGAHSVSPTAPNRTIEISINGTTYYLHAKTTND